MTSAPSLPPALLLACLAPRSARQPEPLALRSPERTARTFIALMLEGARQQAHRRLVLQAQNLRSKRLAAPRRMPTRSTEDLLAANHRG